MKRTSLSAWTGLLAGAGALAMMAGPAAAQKGEVDIYSGQPVREYGIRLGSWGSGTAVETEENSYAGPKGIKVTTHGRFQGARIMLDKPLDLKETANDPTAYLQFTYQVADRTGAGSLGGMEGGFRGPGGKGGAPYGGSSGGNFPGGKGGGGYGAGGGGDAKLSKPKAIANLRIVMVTTDGKRLDTSLATENARTQREDWKGLAIPVAAIPGIKDSSGQIKEILFFGDNPGVVYIGQIRIVRDETPIHVDDLEDRTIAKNDTETFTASADGGPTPLKYEWTIQGVPSTDRDAKSEVTAAYVVTAEGRTYKHQFRKSGDYTITLKVSDMNGLKKTVTKTAHYHVTL